MPNQHHRQIAFERLLEADFRTRYFGHLAGVFQRWEKILSIAVGALSSGALVSLVFFYHLESLAKVVTVAAATLSIVLASLKLNKSAALSASMHAKWSSTQSKYDALWSVIDDLEPREVFARMEEIDAERSKDDEIATAELPLLDRLAQRCQKDVLRSRRLAVAS